MAKLTDCLNSVVKNVSSQTLFFSFLPPQGQQLEADEEYEMPGDVIAAIRADKNGADGDLHVASFLNAVADGVLAIVKQPNPIFYDAGDDITRMLRYDRDASVQVKAVQVCTEIDD